MMDKPIPAFYCCYLLRSTVQPKASLYIGSTPNPVRRIKQHNGITKGGAWRTASENGNGTKRPWEMCLLVTGFPSKIAALQFEWAWQHAHKTRHIAAEVKSPSKQRRPAVTLPKGLKHLNLLLRAQSFSRWPLTLEFFDEGVHGRWRVFDKQIEKTLGKPLDTRIVVHSIAGQPSLPPKLQGQLPESARGLYALNVAYEDVKAHYEKSLDLLNRDRPPHCEVCRTRINPKESMVLVCPQGKCESVSHLVCLSKRFLAENPETNALIPKSGKCPLCQTKLEWRTLVQELTLRERGEKEIIQLLKKKRKRVVEEMEADDVLDEGLDGELDSGNEEAVEAPEPFVAGSMLGDSYVLISSDDDSEGDPSPLKPAALKRHNLGHLSHPP
ncbi:hypothetical protein EJ05DRAFT_513730 [Pseudovirgaria hyperparasitica]|uniref:GIY-YIG domain-containing protein n=1 Tax=Pseudovirgaria hyperparasitica TaxID=470096 RepID=A0A6A6VY86_9PEZI|nr:uncharacterized protein EJ05DRAFT_513730 [Pseudovirgaria hyperparasitica]KAF2754809.1 hypothetical protein EJ05DRAFT_513730 [Pseudovirgaria hyperparasitica]